MYDPPAASGPHLRRFRPGAAASSPPLDDVHAFGRMLLAGGRLPDGSRLLSRASVAGDDHRSPRRSSAARAGPSPDGSQGWGFGVGVQVRRRGLGPTRRELRMGRRPRHRRGRNDPAKNLVGIVLTTDMFVSAFPPPAVIQDFWTCVYAAIDE